MKNEIILALRECARKSFEIVERENEITSDYQRMAVLAKQGKKDSNEFKFLKSKYAHPVVNSSGNVIEELARLHGKF